MEKQAGINEAVEAVTSVIKQASKEVLISTGHLDTKCYDRPEILGAIRAAKERGVRFFVLSGPLDRDTKQAVELLNDDIYLLEQEPIVHFTLADGKHFRLESRYSRVDGIYKNLKRFNDPLNGNYLRDKFFDALSRASKYSGLLAGAHH